MTQQRDTKYPELNAEPGEPWIGVHTLSEFAFCPRAGICSHDEASGDDGEELDDLAFTTCRSFSKQSR